MYRELLFQPDLILPPGAQKAIKNPRRHVSVFTVKRRSEWVHDQRSRPAEVSQLAPSWPCGWLEHCTSGAQWPSVVGAGLGTNCQAHAPGSLAEAPLDDVRNAHRRPPWALEWSELCPDGSIARLTRSVAQQVLHVQECIRIHVLRGARTPNPYRGRLEGTRKTRHNSSTTPCGSRVNAGVSASSASPNRSSVAQP